MCFEFKRVHQGLCYIEMGRVFGIHRSASPDVLFLIAYEAPKTQLVLEELVFGYIICGNIVVKLGDCIALRV